MHLQDGIGRGGYRLLAGVGLAGGLLGVALAAATLDPAGLSEWLGLALAAIGLAGLFGLVLAALAHLGPRAGRPEGEHGEGGPTQHEQPGLDFDATGAAEASRAAPDPGNVAGVAGMAFGEPDMEALEPVSDVPPRRPLPVGPPPRPMPRPAPATAPPTGKAQRGGGRGAGGQDWPERGPPAGVTRRQLHERNLPRDPGPMVEVEGPAGAAATRREPPVVMARTVASAEATGIPEGSSVGKCGNCGVLLLAPKKRPVRLQCPRCERVHTLA